LIASISSVNRRLTASAAALPADFTALPARLPLLAPSLLNPSEAKAASAEVAATATKSATKGL